MKYLISFFILFLLNSSLCLLAQAQVDEEEDAVPTRQRKFIMLTVGIDQDEKLPKMPPVITFKGDFKKVTSAGYSKESNQLRFSPKAEGIATLTIHDQTGKVIAEYHITVKKSRLDAIAKEIRSLLSDIEGITIKIINNRIVVDGQVFVPGDFKRVYAVVKQFGDQASSLVTISPAALKKIAEFIARDVNNPEISVRALNEKIILEGVASSEDEKARAEIIAKAYLPGIVMEQAVKDGEIKVRMASNDGIVNLIVIKAAAPPPPGKIIQLVVHYIELKKEYAKNFNFGWTPSLGDNSNMTFRTGSSTSGGFVSEITGTISNLLPKLNWAKSHGHARVLESTSLIVQDGRTGTLNAYSELPYQIMGKDGPSTSFKKVGIASKVTPVILGERSDTINLDINFQIDSLIGFDAAGPRTSTNQIETAITVRSGQSAAIGGLIRNTTSTGYNKPDNIPRNPLISLYASKDFQRNQSQFVVFITPIVKSSSSAGSERIKKKFRLRE